MNVSRKDFNLGNGVTLQTDLYGYLHPNINNGEKSFLVGIPDLTSPVKILMLNCQEVPHWAHLHS